MPIRTATAVWHGTLIQGKGTMAFGSKAYEGAYSFRSRFEEGDGTNPEELIGAAHAGCFSMALSGVLVKGGHQPERIQTSARVHLNKVGEGFKITRVELRTEGKVPGIERQAFVEAAETAKKGCPVSQALTGVEISVEAVLLD